LLDLLPDSDPSNLGALEHGKLLKFLLGKPLSALWNSYRFRNFTYLFRLKRRALDIPAHMRAIEKVFSWEINETDVATFNLNFLLQRLQGIDAAGFYSEAGWFTGYKWRG
jgi:hypothetical protein